MFHYSHSFDPYSALNTSKNVTSLLSKTSDLCKKKEKYMELRGTGVPQKRDRTTIVETRLREAVKGFRPIYKLQAGRRTLRQSHQNQPIRSSEVGSRRAHETRIVFVSVGFDATRKGVMELQNRSKVVFHKYKNNAFLKMFRSL